MTSTTEFFPRIIEYPDEDGLPMAESDQTREYLVYATKVLAVFFEHRQDVYASGNLFIYYEEGNPEAVVAPDVFVIYGVENRQRRSYKVWQENDRTPNFVLEITSKTTRSKDQGAKKGIYAFLGVQEYYQYDPTGDYLRPPLQGFHLVDGGYVPITTTTLPNGTLVLPSAVLGLELHLIGQEMRFYDPATQRIHLPMKKKPQLARLRKNALRLRKNGQPVWRLS
ncbi:Uma2 family endonuclease [Kovacikia minuta]|uniref:Uma2 family endonuclease n=1 Tax=Kovacikia minuta TaxID=2931930 RepID=UPI002674F2A8